jgi:hypothetical protein
MRCWRRPRRCRRCAGSRRPRRSCSTTRATAWATNCASGWTTIPFASRCWAKSAATSGISSGGRASRSRIRSATRCSTTSWSGPSCPASPPAEDPEAKRRAAGLLQSDFAQKVLQDADGQPLVPEAELSAWAAQLTSQRYGRGEILFRQGDAGDCCFVVLSGALEGHIRHREADRETTFAVGPGAVIGEMSLMTGLPRMAEIRAWNRRSCCGFRRRPSRAAGGAAGPGGADEPAGGRPGAAEPPAVRGPAGGRGRTRGPGDFQRWHPAAVLAAAGRRVTRR